MRSSLITGYVARTFITLDIKYLSILRGNIRRNPTQQTWSGVVITKVQNAISYLSGSERKMIPIRVQYRP
jgi:hypothetical protein